MHHRVAGCRTDLQRTCIAQAIQQLTKLAPATALLLKLDAGGAVADEQEVPIALVQRGDRLKVTAGRHARTRVVIRGRDL